MATGELKWFSADKGYGFIIPADGSPDVFLHISAVNAAGITKLIEAARKLPHGPQRSEAMKKASVMRLAAEKTVKIIATSNET